MKKFPRNTHIVIPAQNMGPAASKGYPAGTLQLIIKAKNLEKGFQEHQKDLKKPVCKCTKGSQEKVCEYLDNELLVDIL